MPPLRTTRAATPLVSTKVLSDGDEKRLEHLRSITNVNGGAVAIGHPTGASGGRTIPACMKSQSFSSNKAPIRLIGLYSFQYSFINNISAQEVVEMVGKLGRKAVAVKGNVAVKAEAEKTADEEKKQAALKLAKARTEEAIKQADGLLRANKNSEYADALLLFNFWNSFSAKLRPILDSWKGPIILYHPVGANHQAPPEYSATPRACNTSTQSRTGTRWSAAQGATNAWLEVELGRPVTISRAVISEGWDRVRQFVLQAKIGDTWQPVATGTTLGTYKELAFDPVSAQVFRLTITEATDVPTIWEFQLFPPTK
jgi:hypothetical protein